MAEEIRPCRHCGTTPELECFPKQFGDSDVRPSYYICHHGKNHTIMVDDFDEDPAGAVDLWNKING